MTMPTSLTQLLETQLEQLTKMNELLLTERQTFIDRNPQATNEITEQKSQQLSLIQTTDKAITSQFTAEDLQTPEAKPLVAAIDELLVELKRENEVNGKIAQNNQMTVKMLKEILFASKRDQDRKSVV